jgi:peptidoglycan/xylan/chitin deacetylase (PgdA/CDA1 family)
LSRDKFAAQLDVLYRNYAVVPLRELLHGAAVTRPRVAITFDDAYRGAVTIGVKELLIRGLTATIFVTPKFVERQSFWWDALVVSNDGSWQELRQMALNDLRGRDEAIRQWALQTGVALRVPDEHHRAANEEELRSAVRSGIVALASHTWSHPNLVRLPEAEVREELSHPLDWLSRRFTDVVPWLAYPYGLSSAAVEKTAAEVGYQAGVRIGGGWLRREPDNLFALPRLDISAGLSLAGFKLRLAGLFS